MKKLMYLLTILSLLLVTACAPASQAPYAVEERALAPSEGAGVTSEFQADSSATANNVYTSGDVPQVERIVIKNATLTIAVEDPAASVKVISQMAEEMGGFVVSANIYHTTLSSGVEVPRASVTVRVPAEQLNTALDRIKAESTQPAIDETISSQDVTKDYTDQQSILRNLETAEAQLQKIMEDAQKTEDVLAVYQQLTQVRQQIEVTKGQIQFYEQSAALSAIQVEIMANAAVQPLSIGGWQPGGVARQALQALINAVQILINAAIWIVLLVIPVLFLVLLPPAVILWIILRWRARRRAKKAAAAEKV